MNKKNTVYKYQVIVFQNDLEEKISVDEDQIENDDSDGENYEIYLGIDCLKNCSEKFSYEGNPAEAEYQLVENSEKNHKQGKFCHNQQNEVKILSVVGFVVAKARCGKQLGKLTLAGNEGVVKQKNDRKDEKYLDNVYHLRSLPFLGKNFSMVSMENTL